MQVKDVLKATAVAADCTVSELLTGREPGLRRIRQVGLMMSLWLTGQSWSTIGRVWRRDRASCRAAALKAEVRLDERDDETLQFVRYVLEALGVPTMPAFRPQSSRHRARATTLRTRIARHETSLKQLRAQLAEIEGAAQ